MDLGAGAGGGGDGRDTGRATSVAGGGQVREERTMRGGAGREGEGGQEGRER